MTVATLVNTGASYDSLNAALVAGAGLPSLADVRLDGSQITGGRITGSYPGGLLVRAAPSVAATGVWGEGVEVIPNNGYVTDIAADGPVTITGLFSGSKLGTYTTSVYRIGAYNQPIDFTCRDSVLGHQANSTSKVVFDCRDYSRSQRILIENCIIHTSAGLYKFSSLGMDVELVLRNCTLIDCNWRGSSPGAVNTDSPKLKLINCYIHSTVGPALEGLQFAELTHCATSDGTAYGLGALTNVAPEDVVVDRAAKDFRLKPGNVLLGKGQDGSHIGATLGFDEPVQPPANQTITATDIALSLSAELETVADGAAALGLGGYSFALMSEPPGVSGGRIEAYLPTADFSLYGTAEAVAEGSTTVSVLDAELALFAQVEGEQQSSGLQVVGIPDSALSLYGEVTRLTAGVALVSLPEAALQLSTSNLEAFGYGDVSLFCADSSLSLVLDVPVVFDKALADLLAVDELDGVFRLGHAYSANFINSNQLTGSFKGYSE